MGPDGIFSPGCLVRMARKEIAPAFLVEILPAGSSGRSARTRPLEAAPCAVEGPVPFPAALGAFSVRSAPRLARPPERPPNVPYGFSSVLERPRRSL